MKIIVFLLMVTIPLFGSEWAERLNADFLKQYLNNKSLESKVNCISVYAGEHLDEAKKAHDVYVLSLKKIKQIKQVLPEQMLQDISTLKDMAILKKARVLPIDFISILRVYSVKGEYSTAITIYNRNGKLINGFWVEKTPKNKKVEKKVLAQNSVEEEYIIDEPEEETGKKNQKNAKKELKKEAKKMKTREASKGLIKKAIKEKVDKKDKLTQAFNQKYITFENITREELGTDKQVKEYGMPLLGENQKQIGWKHFYELVGRQDLASQYQSKVNTAIIFWVVGGVSALVSPVFLMGDKPYSEAEISEAAFTERQKVMKDANADDGMKKTALTLTFLAIGLINGGIGLYFYNHAQPVSTDEARKLAIKYNKELKKSLNIPNSMLEKQSGSLKPSYNLTPFIGENSGGLSLGIRF